MIAPRHSTGTLQLPPLWRMAVIVWVITVIVAIIYAATVNWPPDWASTPSPTPASVIIVNPPPDWAQQPTCGTPPYLPCEEPK